MSTIGVCLVARNEADTIAASVAQVVALRDAGRIATAAVVDGGSDDGTDAIAREAGATVLHAAEIRPDAGPVLGKGDSVWRAAAALHDDVLVFLDADVECDLAAAVEHLAGPLLDPASGVVLVKGTFDRRTEHRADAPLKGGRVTGLVARPLLELAAPDLLRLHEPLSGQVAIRRAHLRSLPVVTHYGVEVGMLFDVADRWGADAIAEVDLGPLYNPPQPDAALQAMARQVLVTALGRIARRQGMVTLPGFDLAGHALVERPPHDPEPA